MDVPDAKSNSSSPAPPVSVSAPDPPFMVSFPVPPEIVSADAPPLKLSFAFDPVIVSSPLVPVTVTPELKELAFITILSVPETKDDSKLKFERLTVA